MSTTWPKRPQVTGNHVRALAAEARVALGEKRATALVPHLEMVHAMMDGLDAVTLGETVPATSFSPRWEE